MQANGKDDWTSGTTAPLSDTTLREVAEVLVEKLRRGDDHALAALFELYHDRFVRLVEFRLNHKLRTRLDSSDILQEAYIDASKRLDHFFSRESASISVWLRLIVLQRLQLMVRHHLLTDKRDARREVSIGRAAGSNEFNDIAHLLADSLTSPSTALQRSESVTLVEQMLETLSATDREVLLLRHFEQVPNDEVAEILGISVKAASNRYVRALSKLKDLLKTFERRGHLQIGK
ncbi:MAG: sigma-70 family RNA polymerase sigma factor [Rubripirellula sp.]